MSSPESIEATFQRGRVTGTIRAVDCLVRNGYIDGVPAVLQNAPAMDITQGIALEVFRLVEFSLAQKTIELLRRESL